MKTGKFASMVLTAVVFYIIGPAMAQQGALSTQPAASSQSANQPAASAEEIKKLIVQLGDKDLKVRDAAFQKLGEIGEPARLAIEEAVKAKGQDSEILQRAEELLKYKLGGIVGKMTTGTYNCTDRSITTWAYSQCLIVRSQGQWEEIQNKFKAFDGDKVSYDSEQFDSAKVDFQKQMLIGVFKYGWGGRQEFTVRKLAVKDGKGELEILKGYQKGRGGSGGYGFWRFTFVAVPADLSDLKVSFWLYEETGPTAKDDDLSAAVKDWSVDIGPESGDIGDGLTGVIAVKEKKIKAGQDIQVEFTLKLADCTENKNGKLAAVESVTVWDGACSKGYQNYGFMVVGPDGKSQRLMRQEPTKWEKNEPQTVKITAKELYVLAIKSLADLKIDLSRPGKYVITGIYNEARVQVKESGTGKYCYCWGGSITTNSVTIEVESP